MPNKHILMILDGYGIAENPSASAIDQAQKPFLDELFSKYPHSTLEASGRPVGLPSGQMGNSEVGHMNLGAGRIVNQEITRIDLSIEDGSINQNEVLITAARHAKNTRLHLIGLFSDGGVHSHIRHLIALCKFAHSQGLSRDQICIHAFSDGRDSDPHGGIQYAQQFEETVGHLAQICTVIGRYHAMDRDRRWERTGKAYRMLVHGQGKKCDSVVEAFQSSYDAGITDEFIEPHVIESVKISDSDAVIFFNFRADRGRQLVNAFTQTPTDATFAVTSFEHLFFATLTPYDKAFGLPVAYDKVDLKYTLGEVIANAGLRQLRVAETEKYPHVTYFFSGGREKQFKGEHRLLINSPKVATYDLQPEMSAPEVAVRCADALRKEKYDFVCINFANADMVGHTGVFEAAVKAVEAVDQAVQVVVETACSEGYGISIIADHGNADLMHNEDGSPNTAHSTALVPHLIIKDGFRGPIHPGKLGDIAPTILHFMGISIPEKMTGKVLVNSI
ncbi:MAG: 2,3-bisphosphoglycerate-independent phosphoglycerate mutase [Bacteroidetes bacterium]|nr:2,3-bisphosphoglycerate-independent phosphoglycerate mutase [Bacteroidota bacterium]